MDHGTVFNIQRFSINDGPGIRTAVFLKGCALDCLWCHNPESKNIAPELLFYADRCVGCGECLSSCKRSLHAFSEDGTHQIDRAHCLACGACSASCVGALQLCGKEMTCKEVMEAVAKDTVFYKNSGGGMTITGGEPFLQHAFALSLLKAAREQGIHTAIETSGYVSPEILKRFLPYVDLFLWDVKETDDEKHRAFTGVSNRPILENLALLNECGAQIILRCPLIEGYNLRENHLVEIGKLAEQLHSVIRVEVSPYHPLGSSKSTAMGKSYVLGDMAFLSKEKTDAAIAVISSSTKKPVTRA